MQLVQDVVHAVRQVRTLTQVGERTPLDALLTAPRAEDRRVLGEHAAAIRALGFLEGYEVAEQADRPPASAVASAGAVQVFVALGEGVDTDKLKAVLQRRIERIRGGMAGVDKKLANERFLAHADPGIVAAEKARREEMALELELLERNLEGL